MSEWQKIETAPMDGQHIIVCVAGAPRTDLTDQERAENRARVAALMRGLGK